MGLFWGVEHLRRGSGISEHGYSIICDFTILVEEEMHHNGVPGHRAEEIFGSSYRAYTIV